MVRSASQISVSADVVSASRRPIVGQPRPDLDRHAERPRPSTRARPFRRADRRSHCDSRTTDPPSAATARITVPTFPGSAIWCRNKRDGRRLGQRRERIGAEHPDHTRRVSKLAEIGHHRVGQRVHGPAAGQPRHQPLGRRPVARDERLNRQDRGAQRLRHEILALGEKQSGGHPVFFLMQPPRVFDARVGARCDRRRSHRCARGYGVARAVLAASAITPKALGSVTARSASTLRSSVMSASLRPCMNWL